MEDFFDKSLNFGLGLFDYTREKAEQLVDEMVKRGEVHRKDAQGLVGEIVKRGEAQRQAVEKFVRDEVDKALGKTAEALHIPKKESPVSAEELRKIVREEIAAALKPKAPRAPKTPSAPNPPKK